MYSTNQALYITLSLIPHGDLVKFCVFFVVVVVTCEGLRQSKASDLSVATSRWTVEQNFDLSSLGHGAPYFPLQHAPSA